MVKGTPRDVVTDFERRFGAHIPAEHQVASQEPAARAEVAATWSYGSQHTGDQGPMAAAGATASGGSPTPGRAYLAQAGQLCSVRWRHYPQRSPVQAPDRTVTLSDRRSVDHVVSRDMCWRLPDGRSPGPATCRTQLPILGGGGRRTTSRSEVAVRAGHRHVTRRLQVEPGQTGLRAPRPCGSSY